MVTLLEGGSRLADHPKQISLIAAAAAPSPRAQHHSHTTSALSSLLGMMPTPQAATAGLQMHVVVCVEGETLAAEDSGSQKGTFSHCVGLVVPFCSTF